MADRRKLIASLALTLTLVALNLIAFNALLGKTSLRLDLTEDNVYSITPATKRLLNSLEEDAVIYGYFSKRTHPKLAPLVPQIEDLLAEYEAVSGDRVQVRIVDPSRNAEAEQEATDRFGVKSTPFRLASKYETGIVNAYFALVVKYGDQYVRYGFDELIEVEPLPDGDIDVRLRNLEYDLTRALKKVVYGFRGTAELFERLAEPIRFTVVMTPESLPEVLKDVPDAVRKAAEELEEKGGDSFEYEEIDPSADEQLQAEVLRRFGARPMALGLFSDEQFYLYGFLEYGGRLEQLALTAGEVTAADVRETIEDVLRRQAPGFLKTVGLVTPEPQIPPEVLMQLQMQGRMPPQPPPEFEQVREMLERDYQVRQVDLDAGDGVPTDVDILVVLKPRDLDDRQIYRLDQYLMRGGRVILGVGNYEAKLDQSGLRVSPVESGLDDWLAHFGIEIPSTMVLDDRNQPLPIPEVRMTALGAMRTWRMEPYPYLVEVRDEGLVNREVAGSLRALGLYWPSPLRLDEEKVGESVEELQVLELLRSSERSWTDDDVTQVITAALEGYQVPAEGTEPRLLALALSGRFKSFFAGKQPPREQSAPAEEEPDEGAPPTEVPLERSPATRLVVIGNAEFLSDFVASVIGTMEGGFFGENLAFMQNLIDWTNLDNDMIGIRSRGATARRLERVERPAEVTIETANYLAAVAILVAISSYFVWRRRNVEPVIEPAAAAAPPATRRAEG